MKTLKVALVAIIATLTTSFALAGGEPFFPERSLDGKTYTKIFLTDVYLLEGLPSNSLVDACKIMHYPYEGNPASVKFTTSGGSQTLSKIFEESQKPTSDNLYINC
jgi:hypothetical protein